MNTDYDVVTVGGELGPDQFRPLRTGGAWVRATPKALRGVGGGSLLVAIGSAVDQPKLEPQPSS